MLNIRTAALNVLKRLVLYRRPERPAHFAVGWFLAWVGILVTAALLGVKWLIPGQFSAPWYTHVGWFTALHASVGCFEHLFHRYVLHKVVFKALAPFKEKHTEHHLLTPAPAKKGRGYAIETEHQHESSAFPAYALLVFWGVFAPLFGLLQLAFPSQPVILNGILAVAFSYTLYEVKHYHYHLPYEEYWRRRISGDVNAREYYGFHLLHHMDIGVNMAIGGFFGKPVFDKLFGTYYVPLHNLPSPAGDLTMQEITVPEPYWPIRQIDRWVEKLLRKRSEKVRAIRTRSTSPPS